MNQVVKRYLKANLYYNFTAGPNTIHTINQAQIIGINCVSLFHLFIHDAFGYELPHSLRSYEMTQDKKYFNTINSPDNMQFGDVVAFGLREPRVQLDKFVPQYKGGELVNWSDYPIKHFAVYMGTAKDKDYLMLHASTRNGTVSVEPLKMFAQHEKYKRIYYIRRLKEKYKSSVRYTTL